MLSKNQIIELTITGITAEGNGVGRAEDGMAVFVPMTAVGDVISAQIVKVLKNYAFGIIHEIKAPSPDRVEPDCPVFKKCGGCTFRHISYEAELKIKSSLVEDNFKRIGGFSDIEFETIKGCDETDHYRNKAQYPLGLADGEAVCGFYSKRSHRIVPYTECRLQPEIFSEITEFVMNFIKENHIQPYNEETGKGLIRHIYLRKGYHSNEIMLCFVASSKKCVQYAESLCSSTELLTKFPDIKSVAVNINGERTNVILGNKNITVSGSETITDIMCKNKISLSPLSFYQVNTAQAEILYGIAADFADLNGTEEILDLYCGAGTIGLSMHDKVKKLTGVEVVSQAVENAKLNAKVNNIKNADFICGDAGMIADSMAKEGRKPDLIIVDPPRKGCDAACLEAIKVMAPDKLVMISCNPSTAARDCKILCTEMGMYKIEKVRAVDLFPRTGHVETVCLLSRKASV